MLVLFLSIGWPAQSAAYAVLAHEAIIDSAWDTNVRPLLLKRFPAATVEQLKEAHAYAYGGAIIQDMGYYPHGSKLFSDLTHYVRSGDFILALLRDSKDLDGYAFALGALSHYAADNDGHLIGVNRAVPILYPNLKKKYGDLVTYEESPLAQCQNLDSTFWRWRRGATLRIATTTLSALRFPFLCSSKPSRRPTA